MVDDELDDYDIDEQTSSQHLKVPFDAFLYDFCHVRVYKERHNNDEQAFKEESVSGN